METKDKKSSEKIKIAQLLTKLAILKNAERSEHQIAAMAGYLGDHFSFSHISHASEYLLQRSKFFPDISEYFNLLDPLKTLDQEAYIVLLAYRKLMNDIPNFAPFKQHCTIFGFNTNLAILDVVGWNKSLEIKDRELMEVIKGILNRPEFYLKTTQKKLE